ncbi:hypothetical protein NMY22_g8859 [Coprinellus aureogranulatus]|nr:hypothetical protein NMY22_g8859 [Coprinellus aureogranulatus]
MASLSELTTIFLRSTHIVVLLLQVLPFPALIRFRHQPVHNVGKLIHDEIRWRVFVCLDRWIPFSLVQNSSRSSSTAEDWSLEAFVREVFLLYHENAPQTSNILTIIAGTGDVTPLETFLEEQGFEKVPSDPHDRSVDLRGAFEVLSRMQRYRKRGLKVKQDDGSEEEEPQDYFIVLLYSRNGSLSVLMSVDNTADMVAISHDTMVSYYPRLMFANEGLLCNASVEADSDSATSISITSEDEEVELMFNNYHWSKPCGPWCPALWRCTYDDEGALKLHWNGTKEHDASPGSAAKAKVADEGKGKSGDHGGHETEKEGEGSGAGLTTWNRAEAWSYGDPDADDAEDIVGPPETVFGGLWGGVAFWNTWANSLDFTYSEILEWRILNRCRNTHCPNSHLHDSRSQYVRM